MTSVTRVLGSLALVVAVVLGTLWFLNSTRPGLEIKCRFLNDVGACLVVVLTQPAESGTNPFGPGGNGGAPVEAPTPNPAEVEAARRAAAEARIDRAGQAVASDLADLADSVATLRSDAASIQDDLDSMAADLASVHADLQTVLDEAKDGADSGTICGDAGVVEGDSGVIQGDLGVIEGDGGVIDGDTGLVQSAIERLTSDAAELASARADQPDYADGGPTAVAVTAAIESAQGAITNAQKAYASDLAKAQGYVKTADKYATSASKACDEAP